MGCISFDSYIKPQPCKRYHWKCNCCISFDSYIKPQLIVLLGLFEYVVYLLIPTSNHNLVRLSPLPSIVVYLLIPTSNHNGRGRWLRRSALYIFWFLHQTTTVFQSRLWRFSCISFDSYIKPQLTINKAWVFLVVYLLIPTSNHNWEYMKKIPWRVVYLLIPTSNHNTAIPVIVNMTVVYLLIPTSNHNFVFRKRN